MKLHMDVAPCVTARLISPTPIKQDVAAAELSVKMMVFQFVHVVPVYRYYVRTFEGTGYTYV